GARSYLRNVWVEGNYTSHLSAGGVSDAFRATDVLLRNNVARMAITANYVDGVKIEGNKILGDAVGVFKANTYHHALTSSRSRNIEITGNTVYQPNNGRKGIVVAAVPGLTKVNQNILIKDNIVISTVRGTPSADTTGIEVLDSD